MLLSTKNHPLTHVCFLLSFLARGRCGVRASAAWKRRPGSETDGPNSGAVLYVVSFAVIAPMSFAFDRRTVSTTNDDRGHVAAPARHVEMHWCLDWHSASTTTSNNHNNNVSIYTCVHQLYCRDEEDDLLDDRDLSDDENGNGGLQMAAMDGSEAFHQVVKDMLLNGHQVIS